MLIGNYIALIILTGSDGISWQQMRFGRWKSRWKRPRAKPSKTIWELVIYHVFALYFGLSPISELARPLFFPTFSVDGASWTSEPGMIVANWKLTNEFFFSFCLIFLSPITSHRLKKDSIWCRNLNHRNLLFLLYITFNSPDLNC